MSDSRRLISVVAPCLNERECLPLFLTAVRDALEPTGYEWEIIIVDDGSGDGTWSCVVEAGRADPRVRGLRLSRNFGHDAAITAGVDHARGDAVIVMDADLQHPPALLPRMLEAWAAGADVVLGVRRDTADATAWKRWTSRCYYAVMNRLSGVQMEPGAPDFRLMSRPVVEALRQCGERVRLVRGLVSWLGFSVAAVPFDAAPRAAGASKFTTWRMTRKGLAGLIAFSTAPLRAASMLGLGVVVFAVLYFIRVIYTFYTNPAVVPGWASLMATLLLLGGIQLLCIGILGEYLARTYEEVKGRPIYVVRERAGGPATDRRAT